MVPDPTGSPNSDPATRPGSELSLATPEVAPKGRQDLHICAACGSDLVHPLEWEPLADRYWRIVLWCPNCECRSTETHSQQVLDRFDLILHDATESLLEDLAQLQYANMEEELERFSAALAADRILPEDF